MAENVDININVNAGDGSKSVGELGKSIDNLKGQFDGSMKSLVDFRKELKDIQIAMSEAGKAGDKAGYDKLKKRYTEVKDAAKTFREETIPLEDHMKTIGSSIGTVVSAGQNLAVIFGADSKSAEELFKVFAKAQAVTNLVGSFSNMMDLVGKLPAAIEELSVSLKAMGASAYASLGPWGLLAVAIAAVAAAITIYILSTKEMTDAEKEVAVAAEAMASAMDSANQSAAKELATSILLLKSISDENATRKDREKNIKKLDELMPGVLSKMDREKLLAGETETAYKKLSSAIYQKAEASAYESQLAEAINERMDKQLILAGLIVQQKHKEKLSWEQQYVIDKAIIKVKEEYNDALNKEKVITNLATASMEKYNKLSDETPPKADKATKAIKEKKKALEGEFAFMKMLLEIEANEEKKALDEKERLRNEELKDTEEFNKKQDKFLNDRLANNDKEAEAAKELSEKKKQYRQAEIDQAQELLGALGDLIQSNYDKEISDTEEKYDAQIEAAEAAGQDTTNIEKKKQREIVELQREAGEKKKILTIANIQIDAAQAIVSAWASAMELGYPANLVAGGIMTALIAATAVAQSVTVANQKFALGGYVRGVGDQDTVPAMLTPGEFVLKKDVVEQLNSGQMIDYERLASVLNDKKVIVVESDITRAQKNVSKIETRSTF